MRKSFKIEELCCANCAAKIEDAINKIDGVNSASINFMAQKLNIDVEDGRLDEIMDEAQRIATRIERDVVFVR